MNRKGKIYCTIGMGILLVVIIPVVGRIAFQLRSESYTSSHAVTQVINLCPSLRLLEYRVRQGLVPDAHETFVRVLVKAKTSGFSHAFVPKVTAAGNIFTSYCPLSRLHDIKRIPEIERVEIAGTCLLRHWVAEDAACPEVFRRVPLSKDMKLSGRGVIVGIIDVGVALRNADFFNPESRTTRVLCVWDQTGRRNTDQDEGDPVYGRAYDRGEILDAMENGESIGHDPDGHGTAAASVCTGRWGIAPQADMIVVKFARAKAEVVDAIAFIFRKAQEVNRPCVINVPHGMEPGLQPGVSLFEQALDALSGEGRIIVCSAGNRRPETQFMKRSDHGVVEMELCIRPKVSVQSGNNKVATGILTLDGRFDDCVINIRPEFEEVVISHKDGTGRAVLSDDMSIFFSWERVRGRELADRCVLLWESANSILDARQVTLRARVCTRNDGTQLECIVGAWTSRQSGIRFVGGEGRNLFVPSSPGTARSVISVGSSNQEGMPFMFPVSLLRSRDNRTMKPDYYAPGQGIIGSMPCTCRLRSCDKRHTGKFSGSSISAAQVTGCVAWVLQHYPTLDPQQVKVLLDKCGKNVSKVRMEKEDVSEIWWKAIIPQDFGDAFLEYMADRPTLR